MLNHVAKATVQTSDFISQKVFTMLQEIVNILAYCAPLSQVRE